MKRFISIILIIIMLLNLIGAVYAQDYNYTLQPGKSYEFINKSGADINISTNSNGERKFDEAIYYKDGGHDSYHNRSYSSVHVAAEGRTVVTVPASSKAIGITKDTNVEIKEVSGPALHIGTLKAGKSYEVINKSGAYINISNNSNSDRKFDEAMYYKDGGCDSYHNRNYSSIHVAAEGRTVVTIPSSSLDIEYYHAYEKFIKDIEIKEVSEPALYIGTLKAGKSYEFINKFGANINISTNSNSDRKFDEAIYYKDGGYDSYHNRSYSSVHVAAEGRTVVTIPSSSLDIEYYHAYEKFVESIEIKEVSGPALYIGTLKAGKNYEFINKSGADINISTNSNSERKFDEALYYKDGKNYIYNNRSYSSIHVPGEGHTLVTVPSTSLDIEFYHAYENYMKWITDNTGMQPKLDTINKGEIQPDIFKYDKIDNSKTKEEILNSLKESYSDMNLEQKQNDDTKEEVIRYAEYALEKIATKEVAATADAAEIGLDTIKEQVTKAKEAKKEIEKLISDSQIEANREIEAEVKVKVTGHGDKLSTTVKKDLTSQLEGIDYLKIDTGEVVISLPSEGLSLEIGGNDDLVIEITKDANTAYNTSNYVAALGSKAYGNVFGTALNYFNVTFKSAGKQIGKLMNKVKLSLPIGKGEAEYNCVFLDKGTETEPIGGKYNKVAGKIEIQTKEAGKYYVMENKKTFTDISSKDEMMKKAIEVMASKGIIGGKGEGKFDPDAPISRSEFTKLIVRTLYIYDKDAEANFKDIKKGTWDYLYIASSKQEKLIDGYEDITFRGKNNIQKQEIIKICAAVLNEMKGYYFPKDEQKYLSYSDNIPNWVKKYVALATREGLIVKREDNKLMATQTGTRGEAALMLYRLFNRL